MSNFIVAAFGYSEFITMLKSGFSNAMTVAGKVLDSWPVTGLVLVPFVIGAIVAVLNKLRG